MLSHFSCFWIFATLQIVARQVPLSMGFPRQEYWSGLLFSPSRGSPQPRDRTSISYVSCIGWQVLYHYHHLGSPGACMHNRWLCDSILGQGVLGDHVTTLADKQCDILRYALYGQRWGQWTLVRARGITHLHLVSQTWCIGSGTGIFYPHFINKPQKVKTICLRSPR